MGVYCSVNLLKDRIGNSKDTKMRIINDMFILYGNKGCGLKWTGKKIPILHYEIESEGILFWFLCVTTCILSMIIY
jgi:hypothetical protein